MFAVGLDGGEEVSGRRVLLALGVRDILPAIDGLSALWGRGVLHCPYCHGWEVRDEPLALYASGSVAMDMAPLLLQWSRDLLLCTGGVGELAEPDRETLTALGVRIIDTPVLTQVKARFTGLDVYDVEPASLPDVMAALARNPGDTLCHRIRY